MNKMSISPTITLLVYYSKQFPRSNALNYILIFLQLLPAIIITHDWNLCFETGVSFWIRKLTFIRFFAFFPVRNIYHFFIIAVFLLGILHIIFFMNIKRLLEKHSRLSSTEKKQIKISAYLLYIPYYLLTQFLYSIYVEILFCPGKPINLPHGLSIEEREDCRGLSYIIYAVFITFNVLFSIVFTIINQIMLFQSFYIPNSILMNPLGKIYFYPVVCPFLQAVLQFEYHLSFTDIIIIKNVFRSIYVILYIWLYAKHYDFLTKSFLSYLFKFTSSMCFCSCLIEWGFAYGYNQYAITLIGDYGTISLKMLIEVLGAKCLVSYYDKAEVKILNGFIKEIAFAKRKKNHNEMMMKLCLFIYQLTDINAIYLFSNSILNICKEHTATPNNSDDIGSNSFYSDYKSQFEADQFREQQETFMKKAQEKRMILMDKSTISIKESFPLLFEFIRYCINSTISKAKGTKNNFYLHSNRNLLLFDLIYDQNLLKCLLTIEKFKRTSLYTKNFIFRLQIHLMQQYLIAHYKVSIIDNPNQSMTKAHHNANTRYLTLNMNFKSLQAISSIELMIRDCLQEYISIMSVFNEEDIHFSHFIFLLKRFNEKYFSTKLRCQALSKSNHCCIPYLSKKFELFFNYFQETIPSDISSAFEHFFTRSSLTTTDETYSIILLKVDLTRSSLQFALDYASDDLISKLKYAYEDFYSSPFENLFPKSFVKPYTRILEDMITKGKNSVKISDLCLIDKDKFALLFDLIGIPVFGSNTFKIFIKVKETKEDTIVFNQQRRMKKKRKQPQKMNEKSDNSMKSFCGNCYLFASKSGKIISISRGFGDFFYLTSSIILKHRLHVRDLLRVEVLNREGYFHKDLNDIYENIIQLNNEAVGQIGEDDFSKAILSIKETQKSIKRNATPIQVIISYEKKHLKCAANEKRKSFYIFILQAYQKDDLATQVLPTPCVHSPNDRETSFSSLAFNQRNSLINQTVLLQQQQQTGLGGNEGEYAVNQIECQEKILLIRNISFKLLETYFGYKTKVDGLEQYSLNKYADDDKEITQNEVMTSKAMPTALSPINDSKRLLYLIKTKALHSTCNAFAKYGSIIIILLLLGYFLAISFRKIDIKKSNCELMVLYGDFLVVYIRLTALIQNVVNMQIQSNRLQNASIDNNFPNTFDYYHTNLCVLLDEYEVFSYRLIKFMTLNYHPVHSLKIASLVETKHNLKIMNRDGTKGITEQVFNDINYIPSKVRPIIDSGSFIIFFNESSFYVKEVESYYTQYEYVNLIENFISVYRYVFADTMVSFPEFYIFPGLSFQEQLSIGLLCQSCLFVVFMYICLFFFLKAKMSLFAKYFANYTQLRFFNLFIMKKSQSVLNYIMNNGDNTKDIKEIIRAIGLVNDKQEIKDLKYIFNDQSNSNISSIRVSPFKIKLNREVVSSQSSYKIRKSNDNNNSCLLGNSQIVTSPINGSINPFKSKQETYQLTHRGMTKTHKNSMKRHESQKIMIISKDKGANIYNEASSINTYSTLSSNKLMVTGQSNINTNANNGTSPITLSILNRESNALNQSRRKLLDKPFNSLFFVLFISFLLLSFLLIDVIELVLGQRSTEIVKSMIEAENCVFRQIELLSSMLVVYQISLLKNEELTSNYTSVFTISYCPEGDYSNNISHHIVFGELTVCLGYISKGISRITIDNNLKDNLQKTSELLAQLNSGHFCEAYARYLIQNKSHSKIKELEFLNNETEQELVTECQRIGSGFNSEGYGMALNSMQSSLVSFYQDFTNDNKRNEVTNYNRINDKNYLMIQIEYYHVIQRVPYLFLITFSNDFLMWKNKEVLSDDVFFLCKLFMMIVISAYYFYSIVYFSKEEKLIEFFNDSVLNTILF